MAKQEKVVQVWRCDKCDHTQNAPVRYSAVFCPKQHNMKLVEGEAYLPKKKK
jgi:hypothetical protein